MPKRCLIVGAVMLDIRVELAHLPLSGDDVEMYNQEMALGGCAYNVSDMLQHFQVSYDLCAPVGTGYYADIIRQMLSEQGKTTLISTEDGDNGYCLCLLEKNGERTFLTLSGVECRFEEEWLQDIDPQKYDSAYVCGYELEGVSGRHIVTYLEDHREWKLFYAPGPRICSIPEETQKRILALHPILHLNEKEALSYTGCVDYEAAAKALHEWTDAAVIITLGEKGSYLFEDGQGTIISSSAKKAVDTTGAGDSHIGTIIAAMTKGSSLENAVRLANKVSAYVVTVPGPVLSRGQFNNAINNLGEKNE